MKDLRSSSSLKTLVISVLYLFLNYTQAEGQLLNRSLSINANFSKWDLEPTVTEAGNNYSDQYTSPSGQMKITVGVPLLLGSGKVTVQHVPTNWDDRLGIRIRREGVGSTLLCALCSINNGQTYINVGQTATYFFDVTTLLNLLMFNDMELQLQITGASVLIPANTYATKIVFTIGPL